MLIKKISRLGLVILLGSLAFEFHAQTTSVFTTGLNHPTKVITSADNSLLVSESGTMTPNTGRISIVDRTSGARHTLISGLPSGVSNLGGPPETDGTTGICLQGRTLYVTNGIGDGARNVGPGLEAPGLSPSSPIFDSILELTLPGGYATLDSSFTLSLADQNTLAGGTSVVLTNSEGKQLTVRLVADLPDYRSEPRLPLNPDNVRASHLFGCEIYQKDLYVANAAFNLVHRVNIASGETTTFVTFPSKVNPLFGTIGGPFVEAVPDNIHRVGNQLLIPLLSGFPFAPGVAEIQAVSLKDAANQTLIPGLRSAIDVLQVETDGGAPSFYTLEFSSNQLAGSPGRMKFFSSADATPEVVVPVLISPTSMTRDDSTGDIYVINIFPGTITRVQFP